MRGHADKVRREDAAFLVLRGTRGASRLQKVSIIGIVDINGRRSETAHEGQWKAPTGGGGIGRAKSGSCDGTLLHLRELRERCSMQTSVERCDRPTGCKGNGEPSLRSIPKPHQVTYIFLPRKIMVLKKRCWQMCFAGICKFVCGCPKLLGGR